MIVIMTSSMHVCTSACVVVFVVLLSISVVCGSGVVSSCWSWLMLCF